MVPSLAAATGGGRRRSDAMVSPLALGLSLVIQRIYTSRHRSVRSCECVRGGDSAMAGSANTVTTLSSEAVDAQVWALVCDEGLMLAAR